MNSILKFLFKKKNKDTTDNDVEVFEKGYKQFQIDGKYNELAYYSMINLFCKTDNKYLEEKHQEIIKKITFNHVNKDLEGVLGVVTKDEFVDFNNTINQDGYVFFKRKLPKDLLDNLVKYAETHPCYSPPNFNEPKFYDPHCFNSEIFRFKGDDLMNNLDFQKLIIDPTILNIARNYLQTEPIFDFPALWWSTNYLDVASEDAAQLYHFDLDRIKWLKFFVYLTDVTDENGPHCFIKGTHKHGSKPYELLKRGYKRIPDEEILIYYNQDQIVQVCAEAGTMFAGDTKCWHKGSVLQKGHRLVLELQYTADLFGSNYPDYKVVNYTTEFKDYCLKNSDFSKKITFK